MIGPEFETPAGWTKSNYPCEECGHPYIWERSDDDPSMQCIEEECPSCGITGVSFNPLSGGGGC